ncbi:hypothetical protein DBV15_03053 [Temnothorax longispinosus]|uniref:Uncharacterized protein n=1 Tax=Temnothorax longispinosus TaxID=300112 RepID=A0A4S2KID4_9HYME|nr:hypothetical protein DBV15_03053 [Temnothorax longispinosus]
MLRKGWTLASNPWRLPEVKNKYVETERLFSTSTFCREIYIPLKLKDLKENMTSNYHSSHCEKDVRYPSTDRVAVGEDYVDFIYQFGKDSKISKKDCKNTTSKNLEFHEAVYPIRISIYEVYNFGNVFEVWAQDSEDESRWILLWNGRPKFHKISQLLKRRRLESRIFSPPLRSCNFKTKMLRLHFISNSCTQLHAVMLIGTSKLIFSKNPEDKTTSFHKSKLMHKQVSREEDVLSSKQEYVNHPLLRIHWNHVKFIKDIKFSSGKSKEQLDSFSALSDE